MLRAVAEMLLRSCEFTQYLCDESGQRQGSDNRGLKMLAPTKQKQKESQLVEAAASSGNIMDKDGQNSPVSFVLTSNT